jgi:uncharacterized protein (TIGR03086 family)
MGDITFGGNTVGHDVVELHRRAVSAFGERVEGVSDAAWRQPTPCNEWDVRALVDHLVVENLWVPPLVAGKRIDEVTDIPDGEVLGDDPQRAWDRSAAAALGAAEGASPDATTHLSFGDVPTAEYLWQLTIDALVHAWDLARATGQNETFDADLVAACADWFDGVEDAYRAAGVIGPAVDPDSDDALARLLGRLGRDASAQDPLGTIVRFNAAFDCQDLEALGGLMADDVTFVDTAPPNGTAHHGRAAVLEAFAAFFVGSPSARFEPLGGFVADGHVVVRWRYRWGDAAADHIDGIDVFTVTGGKVAEKLSFVKG